MKSATRRLSTRKFLKNCEIELTRALIDCIIKDETWAEALQAGEIRLGDKLKVKSNWVNAIERIIEIVIPVLNVRSNETKNFIARPGSDDWSADPANTRRVR